ncbi:glutamine synthetase [Amylibacter kogurei]|uniref:Glutamine synthetase n=1 Tax=Paramylibacter kogurei TaxID=1889778 RepID=A0A2G5K682_9RHOB|nr:glutamine synthetase family protein [Amylibacter kogurei]PIB25048.1 glutamine synthetase [Amylibacter kogurei]
MSNFSDIYTEYCQTHGTPERIEIMLCDMNAVLRGKWLPSSEIDKLGKGSVRLPMSTYCPNILGNDVEETGLGIVSGDPDANLVPVVETLCNVPWADGDVAQILVEMTDDNGEISTLSSRQILANVWDRFKAQGLHPVIACELEFYVFHPRDDPDQSPTPPDWSPDAQNYDLDVLSRSEDLLRDIQAAALAMDMPIDTLIAEFGPGQFEINFQHTDNVLFAADTALMFRRLVRGVVQNHGMEATFMAKPYAEHPGNGMHLHASVLDDDGNNIFASDDGVGERLFHAVGGVLETMPELQAIFAPHLNSYRRFQANSFAPTHPNWGLDHRGAAIRLPDTDNRAARLEHRISGADVNPYLAFAAILGGMLHGLDNKLPVPPAIDADEAVIPEKLTHDWSTAVDKFATSNIAAQIFGAEYRDIYATVRRDEIAQLTTEIAPIEYRTYLNRL